MRHRVGLVNFGIAPHDQTTVDSVFILPVALILSISFLQGSTLTFMHRTGILFGS